MFTPCPSELNEAAAKRLEDRATVRRHRQAKQTAAGEILVEGDKEPPRVRPPVIAGMTVAYPSKRSKTKLCRDLKGLFTPCAK